MNIPDTIHIGGLPYMVFRNPPSELGEQREGTILYRMQEIHIVDGETDYAKITFLHEVIHGMFEALGLTDANQDEKLVDGLAHQMYQLLEDNPEMFIDDEGENDVDE